ncbi:MAG: TRAP transporter small permease [Rhodospirillaceae bacterium]|jgi:C4-dicarboxylate transporter DctQ subunit
MESGPQSALGKFVDQLEETFIALVLGLMTLVTFANVVARYVFNDNLLWALEVTVFLFAWLVLIGSSYCVKKGLHLGIDLVANLLKPAARKIMTLIAVLACIVFSLLLLKGSWDYWYPFVTTQAFYETEDVPMPEFLQFLATLLNEGERYEKMPRFIPYLALPLGLALLSYRFIQVGIDVLRGRTDLIIASHEVEDHASLTEDPVGKDA